MAFHLEPITIAAIVTGVIAIIVVLVALVARSRRRSNQESFSSRQISVPQTANTYTPNSYKSPQLSNRSPPTPSDKSTLIGTPVSKLRKASISARSASSPVDMTESVSRHLVIKNPDSTASMMSRPESEEMVMVTYEEGLRKLGIANDHLHQQYQQQPSINDYASNQSQITSPISHQHYSPRTPRTPDKYRPSPRPSPGRSRSHDTPSAKSKRSPSKIGRSPAGSLESGQPVQSTWLPSYYQPGKASTPIDEESELGYRAKWQNNKL